MGVDTDGADSSLQAVRKIFKDRMRPIVINFFMPIKCIFFPLKKAKNVKDMSKNAIIFFFFIFALKTGIEMVNLNYL